MGIRSPVMTLQLGSVSLVDKQYCPLSMKLQTYIQSHPIQPGRRSGVDGAHEKSLARFPQSKCSERQGLGVSVNHDYGG